MPSASTPAAYLASFSPEQRKIISAVRGVIKKHLPKGYVETVNWGMLAYEVPLTRYPDTYNKRPLMYLALAARKGTYTLYMTGVSDSKTLTARLAAAYKAQGKKLDMGKSCVHFKSLDELPLDIIADVVASTSVDQRIEIEEKRLGR
jgi:hypothetical protein